MVLFVPRGVEEPEMTVTDSKQESIVVEFALSNRLIPNSGSPVGKSRWDNHRYIKTTDMVIRPDFTTSGSG